ncbi:MAG: response regulator [Cellvibrionaceae bacterium]|nr:response regulator [Cellvibrionaceae bacterium]
MAIPLLICDDSSMARKQVAKALPEGLDVNISFASNGLEALTAIRQGKGEIVFLDLTMPEMDGFAVLEAIRQEELKSVVIVISGDIQPVARERVLQLGAIDFIKKPLNQEKLRQTLETFGLL